MNVLKFSMILLNIFTGHYRNYPVDYKAAVTELLGKAAGLYSQRIQQLEGERLGVPASSDEIIEPINNNIRKSAMGSNGFMGFSVAPSDPFSSMECDDGRETRSVQDERKEGTVHLPDLPSIAAHGVLGQLLFDVCVPKNVEDWDIRSSDSLKSRRSSSTRRHTHFNPIKCILRSRL